ncbi:MAG: hypothetical protein R2792_18690 [Saprospiraceae bacterium]
MNKFIAIKLVQDYLNKKEFSWDVIYQLDQEPIETEMFWVFKNLLEPRETRRGNDVIVDSSFPAIIVNKASDLVQEINQKHLDKIFALSRFESSTEDELRYRQLEFAIQITYKFLLALLDGYNPVSISIERRRDIDIDEDEIMKFYVMNTQLEQGWDSKLEFTDLSQKINDNFQWLLMHLREFNAAPKLFKSEWHIDHLNAIFEELSQKILELSSTKSRKMYEYFFEIGDGSECKAVLILDDNKSICLTFGNEIH